MKIKIHSGSQFLIPNEYQQPVGEILAKHRMHLESGYWNIPNGYIGYINTPGFSLEVVPNISYMTTLDYIRMLDGFDFVDISQKGSITLEGKELGEQCTNLILKSFDLELRKLMKHGLSRKYIPVDLRSDYMFGQVDALNSQINIKLKDRHPIQTSIEQLSLSFPEMIEIRDAYLKYKFLAKNKIWEFEKIIRFISGRKTIAKLQHVQFRNMNRCYELAYFINNNIGGLNFGSDLGFSILINSNDVFEKYFARVVRRLYPNEVVEIQKEMTAAYLEDHEGPDSSITVKPDILIRQPKTIILDSKNKNFFASLNVGNSDYHQMISYMDAFNAKASVLVYPVVEDASPLKYRVSYNENNKVIIKMPINIRNTSPENLKKMMDMYIYYF